jgi:hypothetical protein
MCMPGDGGSGPAAQTSPRWPLPKVAQLKPGKGLMPAGCEGITCCRACATVTTNWSASRRGRGQALGRDPGYLEWVTNAVRHLTCQISAAGIGRVVLTAGRQRLLAGSAMFRCRHEHPAGPERLCSGGPSWRAGQQAARSAERVVIDDRRVCDVAGPDPLDCSLHRIMALPADREVVDVRADLVLALLASMPPAL